MSDAINYLKEIRPEAVEAYFTFLAKSAEHLDDKTRFLISVITKVDKQTEKGFRQYVKRALKEGNTANEIIDALLVAFPTLGLSKIIWAVEQISEMDLIEFKPENLKKQQGWHSIAAILDIEEGLSAYEIHDSRLLVYKKAVETKVYLAKCPHNDSPLMLEDYADNCLTCPKHQWKFDITSGECLEGGNVKLTEFPSRINNSSLEAYF